jgi:hypothetical protein
MGDVKAIERQPATRVDGILSFADRLGAIRMRLGIGRASYRVSPGLYALETPGPEAPVFVSANYKMSFDALRSSIRGIPSWILVIDTKGINVWCAAGEGTFCADEVARRVKETGLGEKVKRRVLVLPQLSAPGVSAHSLEFKTGFKVLYGPVRASDIPSYLKAGRVKTPDMRRVRFGIKDRLVLAPLELVQGLPFAGILAALLFLLEAVARRLFLPSAWASGTWPSALASSLIAALPAATAFLSGAILSPALLPVLPFRAFAAKGAVAGAFCLAALWPLMRWPVLQGAGSALAAIALSSFYAMNFTGASTFTSLSGTRKEVAVALPAEIALAALGTGILAVRAVLGA